MLKQIIDIPWKYGPHLLPSVFTLLFFICTNTSMQSAFAKPPPKPDEPNPSKTIQALANNTLAFSRNNFGATQPRTVNLYGTWEYIITNRNIYKNSFDMAEIELSARFTAPDGRNFTVLGFYDGRSRNNQVEGIWKIRFMPDQSGTWQYQTQWSDDSPSGTGSFIVGNTPPEKIHGHVHVDPKYPTRLIYDDGSRHYWYGGKWFTAQNYGPRLKSARLAGKSMEYQANTRHYTDTQILDYLDIMEKYKHNGILLKIALFPLEDNRISWDLNWIHRAEWLVEQAAHRGIYVQINIFDTWSRELGKHFQFNTNGNAQLFNTWKPGNEKFKLNYIKTIIARFSGYANIYWELGNEMEHRPNCGDCFVEQANNKYIPWIRKFDPYGLPIGLSEGLWKKTNVDIGFLHQTNQLPSPNETKPTIMNELVRGGIDISLWDKLLGRKRDLWRDTTIRESSNRLAYRRTFWRMFLSGGSGSNEATWLSLAAPLNDATHNVMRDQMYLRNFIESLAININSMQPAPSFIVSGPGEHLSTLIDKTTFASYFILESVDSIGAETIQVTLPQGDYEAQWYEPKTGQFTSAAISKRRHNIGAIQLLEIHNDIVLLLTKRNN